MATDSKIINALMLESPDSSGILARLHRLQKGRSSKWPMQPVCRKLGIPSTGYFSDVIKGKRSLHPKYLSGISKAFGLDKLQQDYLSLMVNRDHSRDDETRKKMQAELKQIATVLQVQYIPIPAQLSDELLWHFLVFSAFSLFESAPTRTQLEQYFGLERRADLESSLAKLQAMGLIEITGDSTMLVKSRIIFGEAEDGFSHIEFTEKSIQEAAQKARFWYQKPDQSAFLSTIITVQKAAYEAALPTLKSRILNILVDLDSSNGDQLVKFNMQLFPYDPKVKDDMVLQ